MTAIERLTTIIIWAVACAVALFMMAPLVVAVIVSFSASPVFNLPPPSWSLRWYTVLASKPELLDAVSLSVQIALISTAISLILGTLCAIAVAQGRFPGREAISTFMISPLMMPGLVLGVALLQFLRGYGLRDAYLGLLIGHVVITLPLVMRNVQAALSLFDFSLLEAARTLGMAPPKAILKVLVPLLAPAYLTSGLFAFLSSIDNYPISMFLVDAHHKTLPIQLLVYLESSPDPTIAAISTCLIVLTVLFLLIADRLVGLRRLAEF